MFSEIAKRKPAAGSKPGSKTVILIIIYYKK